MQAFPKFWDMYYSEKCSETCQRSKMERFAKTVNGF